MKAEYIQRAEDIISKAIERADSKVNEAWNELQVFLEILPPDEQVKHLERKAVELRGWMKTHYRYWKDLRLKERSKVSKRIAAILMDQADGFNTEIPADIVAISKISEYLKAWEILKRIGTLQGQKPEKTPKQENFYPEQLIRLEKIIPPVLAEKGLLNDKGAFTGKGMEVSYLFNALIQKGIISPHQVKNTTGAFSDFFNSKFEFLVSDRTIREKREAPHEREAIRDFCTLITKHNTP